MSVPYSADSLGFVPRPLPELQFIYMNLLSMRVDGLPFLVQYLLLTAFYLISRSDHVLSAPYRVHAPLACPTRDSHVGPPPLDPS